MMFQAQLKAAEEQSAVFSYDGIAYVARVTRPLNQRRIKNWDAWFTCMTSMQLNVPCRHIIAALTSQRKNPVIQYLGFDYYEVKTFQDTFGSVEISQDSTLTPDASIL